MNRMSSATSCRMETLEMKAWAFCWRWNWQRCQGEALSEAKLQQWAKAHGTPQQFVKRCRLVLLMTEGPSALRASQLIGTNRHTAELWSDRFLEHGPETLWDIAPSRPRPGTKTSRGTGRPDRGKNPPQQTARPRPLEHS